MGQSLCELQRFDEAVVALKRAHELSRERRESYGDEITRSIRNVKRRRWQWLEEGRQRQEVALQAYLNRLMAEDRQRQVAKVRSDCGGKRSESKSLLKSFFNIYVYIQRPLQNN